MTIRQQNAATVLEVLPSIADQYNLTHSEEKELRLYVSCTHRWGEYESNLIKPNGVVGKIMEEYSL
jgi:hypothetical protein